MSKFARFVITLGKDPIEPYYPTSECGDCGVPKQLEPDLRASAPNIYREKVEERCRSSGCSIMKKYLEVRKGDDAAQPNPE